MKNIPTVKEFIPDNNYYFVETMPFCTEACILLEDIPNLMIEFAKLHVTAALKAASNVELTDSLDYESGIISYYQNDQGILNCYPLTNII